jgi:hypothetical protein
MNVVTFSKPREAGKRGGEYGKGFQGKFIVQINLGGRIKWNES